MHITLTDRLTCPACGPEAGLVLLAERIEERRVLEGELGCPACRVRYPIRGGFAELREAPMAAPPHVVGYGDEDDDTERATRIAALLGLAERPGGFVLLTGRLWEAARALTALVEDVELVTTAGELEDAPEVAGINRLGADWPLPFFTRSMRAVAIEVEALDTDDVRARVGEALRVAAPTARVLIEADEASLPTVEQVLEASDARVLASAEGAVLAVMV